jgi:cation transporter-like permease
MGSLRKRVGGVSSYHTAGNSTNSSILSHPYDDFDNDHDDEDCLTLSSLSSYAAAAAAAIPLNIMLEDRGESTADIEMVEHHQNKPLLNSRIEEEIKRLRNEVQMLKQIIRNLEPEMEIPSAPSSSLRHLVKHSKSDVIETQRNPSILHHNKPMTFYAAVKDRSTWLVGLLIFQSCSSFILARNEALLQQHPVIVYFLTMLVGAGGNAGNQASVRVIRGLATGSLNIYNRSKFLRRELRMAITLTAILSIAGCLRAVLLTHTNPRETLAITSSLALIVFTSICLGALLPLLLQRINIDPAHSSTTIQVIMDILGVVLTVQVSAWTLGVALPLASPADTTPAIPNTSDVTIDDLLISKGY